MTRKPQNSNGEDKGNNSSLDNLRHWSVLFHTDPAQTKSFTAPGGFQGTATSPTFLYLQLTEHFGPAGEGWGTEKPDFQINQDLVYCIVECWWKDENKEKFPIWGIGGDRIVKKDSRGVFPDDDAFKKAFTDAIGNAFSRLGAGADIRLGLFKDNKYITKTNSTFRETQSEYLPDNPQPQGGQSQTYTAPRTIVSRPPPLKITKGD